MLKNYWKHFITITRHKVHVFRECRKYGLYWQGLTHDLSKYSLAEFRLAKYYIGTGSPVVQEKRQLGYSKSWLHHIHCNKHHWEYWYDPTDDRIAPIPKKYIKEMVCDIIAASKVYNGKNYTNEKPIEYMDKSDSHPQEVKDLIMPLLIANLNQKGR